MSSYLGIEKLAFSPANPDDLSNVGAYVRAGSDGHLITWTNVGVTAASYTGIPAGCATSVTVTAANGGTVGNITLTGDGVKDIATLISDWNTANPTNTVTLTSGSGIQVPTALATLPLTGGVNGKDGLDVNVISPLVIIDAANHNEDAAHTSGDAGKFVLAVRHDAESSMVSNDGDYAPLQVNADGRLKVDADLNIDFDYVYAEDTAHSDGALGAFTLGVRQDTLTSSVSNDGDYGAFKLNDRGAMWTAPVGTAADGAADSENPVKTGTKSTWGALGAIDADGNRANMISDKHRRLYVNNGSNIALAANNKTITDAAATLVAANLAGRRQMIIQNLGDKPIYVGGSAVAATDGLRISPNAVLTLELGQDVSLYGIADTGKTVACRILELA